MIQEGDSLNSFSQTHLICEDHIAIFVPGLDQPVQTLELIISQELTVLINSLICLSVNEWLLSLLLIEIELVLDFLDGGRAELLLLQIEIQERFMSLILLYH